MKRTSKYIGKTFDNGWTCTHVGIANVQGKRAKAPGAINHYIIMERRTSDDKADKMIRLNSTQAAKVYRGELLVEELADKRKETKDTSFARKVSYSFN